MEQYLRVYVNYLQDDWHPWLPLAEFTANNQASDSTGTSPFFGNYGYDHRWQFNLRQPAQAPPIPEEVNAQETAQALKGIHEHLQTEILRAQHRYQEAADRQRLPAPAFKEGDKFLAKREEQRNPSTLQEARSSSSRPLHDLQGHLPVGLPS